MRTVSCRILCEGIDIYPSVLHLHHFALTSTVQCLIYALFLQKNSGFPYLSLNSAFCPLRLRPFPRAAKLLRYSHTPVSRSRLLSSSLMQLATFFASIANCLPKPVRWYARRLTLSIPLLISPSAVRLQSLGCVCVLISGRPCLPDVPGVLRRQTVQTEEEEERKRTVGVQNASAALSLQAKMLRGHDLACCCVL